MTDFRIISRASFVSRIAMPLVLLTLAVFTERLAAAVFLDESAAITSRCAAANRGAAVLIAAAGATDGTAALFTTNGAYGYQHYGCGPLTAGRYRVTLRARVPSLPGPVLRIATTCASSSSGYFWSYGQLDFSDVTGTNLFVERSCDLLVLSYGVNNVVNIPALQGMVFDWVLFDRCPTGAWPGVEATGVWPDKILYGTNASGSLSVRLLNTTGQATNIILRVRVEGGLGVSQTAYSNAVSLTATGLPQTVTVTLPPQSEYGHEVTAEVLGPTGAVSSISEFFYTSERPLQVGQYDYWGIAEAYTWANADRQAMSTRRAYCPLSEIGFWAPCDMSLLVPPAGTNRWWSGQTLAQVSQQQMLEYIGRAGLQGIGVVGYVDYSVVFGCRILDAARLMPEILQWDSPNDSLIWAAYFLSGAAAPGSRQRKEDDSTHSYTSAEGVMRTVSTQPQALKLHGDQLAASMQLFGWAGFRYDDPADYEAPQTDLLGRQTPFQGWSNETVIAYFRQRMEQVNPRALYGHNTDPFRSVPGGNGAYVRGLDRALATEAACMRDGGFCLQEAYSAYAYPNHGPWTTFRDYNVVAGLAAQRAGGEVFVITTMESFGTWDRQYGAALMAASGTHLAYQMSTTPYMQFLCRNCDLLYGEPMQAVTNATAVLNVTTGTNVWWRDFVRCRYTAPGKRVYLAHLINPPSTNTMGINAPPSPAPTNVTLAWTLPAGWTAQKAWHLTPDRAFNTTTYLPKASTNSYDYDTYETGLQQRPTGSELAIAAGVVVVTNLHLWSLVAVECTGPTNDLPEGPPLNLPPAPTPPEVDQTPVPAGYYNPAAAVPIVTIDDGWGASPSGTNYFEYIADSNALDGQAMRMLVPPAHLQRYGMPSGLSPAGRYRFHLRARTEGVNGSALTFHIWNPNGDPDRYNGYLTFDLTGLTPSQGYHEYTGELDLGEALSAAPGLELSGTWTGLVIDRLWIERLSMCADSDRLRRRAESEWPIPDPPVTSNSHLKVWYGTGLYYEYYHVDEALTNLDAAAQITRGGHYIFGQDNRGWDISPFPPTPQALMSNDLVILANIPINTYVNGPGLMAWRHWLRGYVANGGRLLLLGGPLAFGEGGWDRSDILADLMPVTLTNADLKPVGVTTPVPLTPVSALASNVNWSASPKVIWQHDVTARTGSTVHVTAGGVPAIVTRRYGHGIVGVVSVAPLGTVTNGETAFWDWPQWTPLMTNLLASMLAVGNTNPPPVLRNAARSGNWSDTNTWTGLTLPANHDTVTIGSSLTITQDVSSAALDYCTVDGALVFCGWNAALSASVVRLNGTVTHTPNTDTNGTIGVYSDWTPDSRVYIQCADLTLVAGKLINVDGKGYAGGRIAHDGYGPGGGHCGPSDQRGMGAGYGGAGGRATGTCGAVYGTVTLPQDPGSGGSGRSVDDGPGGPGGGVVRIAATGTVTLDGLITADGLGASMNGSGSGGSVHITCGALAGSGFVSADGGSTSGDSSSGGGGGRIAVVYDPLSQSGQNLAAKPTLRFSAGDGRSTYTAARAMPGTVSLTDASFYPPDAGTLGGGLIVIAGFTNWSPSSLSVTGATAVLTGVCVTVGNNLAVSGHGGLMLSNSPLRVGGNLTLDSIDTASYCYSRFYAGPGVDLSIGGNLTIGQTIFYYHANPNAPSTVPVGGQLQLTHAKAKLYVYAGATNASADYGALFAVNGGATITGGWVYASSNPTNGASPLFRMRNLTIGSGAGFNANALGYAGGAWNANGYGPGGGKLNGSGANRGGGGGYGGRGGWADATYGITYGSSNAPILPGSGGGGRNWNDGSGGYGGGLVRLEVDGAATIDGTLTANGGVGINNTFHGPGSGGAIYLRCQSIRGSNGTLTANGGAGNGGTGGGGGGRIAVGRFSQTLNGTWTVTAARGPESQAASPTSVTGTVVWFYLPAHGTVLIVK